MYSDSIATEMRKIVAYIAELEAKRDTYADRITELEKEVEILNAKLKEMIK